MKGVLFLICLFTPFTSVVGQTIVSQVKNVKSQAPVQYAAIGIIGKNIGIISDSLGNFQLSLAHAEDADTLQISMIGYNTKKYKIGTIRTSDFPKIVWMEERIVELQEAIVNTQNSISFQLGLKQKYCYPIPLYKGAESKIAFPQKNYRHEIGTRFTNANTMTLDSIQLNFAECNVNLVELRLNVYTIQNNAIENRLSQPMYITLSKSEALNTPVIRLKERVVIDSDFLITIENYKQLKDGALYIFANFKRKGKPYPTYYRNSSHDNWIAVKSKKSKTIGVSILAFGH